MAAKIGWVDSGVGGTPQKRGLAGVSAGGREFGFCNAWAKAATDGNGTLYFVSEVPSDAILTSLNLLSDVLSGLTSAACGIFKVDPSFVAAGGPSTTLSKYFAGASIAGLPNSTPVDASAILMAATDISSGYAQGSELNLLSALVVQTITTLGATTNGFLNFGLKLWQVLGFTDPKWKDDSYAIGLYIATAGSAAGNLVVRGRYIQG